MKLDGLGQPIVDDATYYLQDARGYVGDFISWWRPDGAGYTCDINDAGKYRGSACRGYRPTDIPWPLDSIIGATQTVVCIEAIRRREHKKAQSEVEP